MTFGFRGTRSITEATPRPSGPARSLQQRKNADQRRRSDMEPSKWSNRGKPLIAATALALGGAMTLSAGAADTSGDRTYMPDYCTNRDVNCVVPDGAAPPARAGAPASVGSAGSATSGSANTTAGSGTGTGGVPTVPAVPTLSGQVPSLPGPIPSLPAQVPTLSGQVPGLPAQIPSATSSASSPDIAPNPTTARTLGRSTGGAATGSSAGSGASGTSAGSGAAAAGGGAARR